MRRLIEQMKGELQEFGLTTVAHGIGHIMRGMQGMKDAGQAVGKSIFGTGRLKWGNNTSAKASWQQAKTHFGQSADHAIKAATEDEDE
jgi:hypothetical protein